MHRVLQSYLGDLATAGSSKQLCQALAMVTDSLYLNAFAYIAIPSTVGRQLRLITNYSDNWRKHYVAQRYETCDPIVLWGIRSSFPFEWEPGFGDDNPFTRRFFYEASSFGISNGYTVPINHWNGRFAALTFATNGKRTEFLQTVRHHELGLRLIAYQFHLQVREKLEPLPSIVGVSFICRERQCLTLVAGGRTFPDIALILGIAPRTVKDYIDGAKIRLDVRTAREAAALFQALR